MAFMINNGWDVAHHHIHEGFKHLGEAYSYNKHATDKFQKYEDDLHWAKCLAASGEVSQYYMHENKLSIKAVILFQAGLEAWISWAYTDPKLSGVTRPNKFVPKWETALKHLDIQHDFSIYSHFYRNVRNPVVHPSNSSDIETVSNIWFLPTYEGFQAGWLAMSKVSAGLDRPFDNDSWENMCNINGAPNFIDRNTILFLKELERKITQKHLSGARKVTGE